MSDLQSAVAGARFDGYVSVVEAGPRGMITLRGDIASKQVADAVQSALGLPVPAPRRIEAGGEVSVAWMSPDELLLMMPYDGAGAALQKVETALAGQHFLAADVSDARAVFGISGKGAREVLAKLCPVDLAPSAFGPGEVRRTRAAQVAAAFWMTGAEDFTLVSFRSVGKYVFDLLQTSARPGGEIGLW